MEYKLHDSDDRYISRVASQVEVESTHTPVRWGQRFLKSHLTLFVIRHKLQPLHLLHDCEILKTIHSRQWRAYSQAYQGETKIQLPTPTSTDS